jgi:RHS repeat-associated protein
VLSVSTGDYGPARPADYHAACENVPPGLDVSPLPPRELTTGSYPFTASCSFPNIRGSFAGAPEVGWLGEEAEGCVRNTDVYVVNGIYYYAMQYFLNYRVYGVGLAIAPHLQPAQLQLDDAVYQFVPLSQPYAQIAVDESTLFIRKDPTRDASIVDFDVFVQDPLALCAENPFSFAVSAAVNGAALPASAILRYESADLRPAYRVNVRNYDVTCGWNDLTLSFTSALGYVSHHVVSIDVGDLDGERSTQDDLYVASVTSGTRAIDAPDVHYVRVFGEFETATKSIKAMGKVTSTFGLKRRESRFGRFQRQLFVADPRPMSGTASTALVGTSPDMGAVLADAGDTVGVSDTTQTVNLYVEGVAILQGASPTHTLTVATAATPPVYQDFTVEGWLSQERLGGTLPADARFVLSILRRDGSPVPVIGTGGSGIVSVAPVSTASAFDGRGVEIAGPVFTFTDHLDSGSRFDPVTNEIVVLPGEILVVSLKGLESRAMVPIQATLDDYEAVTGVTPAAAFAFPTKGMAVTPTVLLHNRQLKVSHTSFAVPGRMLDFSVAQTYRSGHPGSGSLGPGWSASWEACFVPDGAGFIFCGPDGRRDVFARSPSGSDLVIPPGYDIKAELRASDTEILICHTGGGETLYRAEKGEQALRLRYHRDRFGNRITFRYNEFDVIDQVVDDMDRPYSFAFQSLGARGTRLAWVRDFDSRLIRYTYDDRGRLTAVTAENVSMSDSCTVSYAYDEDDRLVAIGTAGDDDWFGVTYETAPSGEVSGVSWGHGTPRCSENFTRSGLLTTHTDTNGVLTAYQFSTADPVLCATEDVDPTGLALMTDFSYNAERRLATTVHPLLDAVTTTYGSGSSTDKRGTADVTEVRRSAGSRANADGGVTGNSTSDLVDTYTYDPGAFHQNVTADYADGSYAYSHYAGPLAVLAWVDVPDQSASSSVPLTTYYTYNDHGQVEMIVRTDGSVTEYSYYQTNDRYQNLMDLEGYIYSVTTMPSLSAPSSDRFTTYTGHDISGNIVSEVTTKAATTLHAYDGFGNRTVTWHPTMRDGDRASRVVETYAYDNRGRQTAHTVHNPVAEGSSPATATYHYVESATASEYDDSGRLSASTAPGQNETLTTTYGYDGAATRPSWVLNPNQAYTHLLYDSAGRTTTVITADDLPDGPISRDLPLGAVAEITTLNDNGEPTLISRFYGSGSDAFSASVAEDEVQITRDWSGRASITENLISGGVAYSLWNGAGQADETWSEAAGGQLLSHVVYTYHANGDPATATQYVAGTTVQAEQVDYTSRTQTSETTAGSTPTVTRVTTRNCVGHAVGTETSSGTGAPAYSITRQFDKDGMLLSDSSGHDSTASGNSLANAPVSSFNATNHLTRTEVPELGATGSDAYRIAPSGIGAPGVVADPDACASARQIAPDGSTVTTQEALGQQDERATRTLTSVAGGSSIVLRGSQATRTLCDLAGRPVETTYHYGVESEEDLGDETCSEVRTYDRYGRTATVTRKDGTTLFYSYYPRTDSNLNSRDQLHEIRDDANHLVRHLGDYNCFGKPTVLDEFYSPGDTTSYVRLVQVYYGDHTPSVGSTDPAYGRLESETTTVYSGGSVTSPSLSVTYTYDSAGRRAELFFPGGDRRLAYTYDPLGRLDTLLKQNATGTTLASILHLDYDPDFPDLVTQRTILTNSVLSISYAAPHLGLVGAIQFGSQYLCTFAYDRRGQKTATGQWQNLATNTTRTYTYDGLQRARAAAPATGDAFGTEAFPLDSFENLNTSETTPAVLDGKTLAYSAAADRNRYAQVVDSNAAVRLTGTPGYEFAGVWYRYEFDFAAGTGTPATGTGSNSVVTQDFGAAYATRADTLVVGWGAGMAALAVNRTPVPGSPAEYASFIPLRDATGNAVNWELAVEDGDYRVTVVTGDPGDTTATAYSVGADGGVTVISGTNDPANGDYWLVGSAWVTVSDGRLTLSGGTADSNLCWVSVEAAAGKVVDGPTPSVTLQDALNGSRTYSFAHDGLGNVAQDHEFTFTWDSYGRLASAQDSRYVAGSALHPVPQSVLYLYDALGRRVARLYDGQEAGTWPDERVVYDGLQPIEERSLDGSTVFRRYWNPPAVTAPLVVEENLDGNSTVDGTGDAQYVVLTDDRGTVMGVAGPTGTLAEKLFYNTTGVAKSTSPAGTPALDAAGFPICHSRYVRFGWAGMYREFFTGLGHTHFREYSPLHGRWLSEDPAGYADGLNLYAYCANDPVNAVDPLGLEIVQVEGRYAGYGYYHVYGGWHNENYLGTVRYRLGTPDQDPTSYAAYLAAKRIETVGGDLARLASVLKAGAATAEIAIRVASDPLDDLASAVEFAANPSVVTAIGCVPLLPGGFRKLDDIADAGSLRRLDNLAERCDGGAFHRVSQAGRGSPDSFYSYRELNKLLHETGMTGTGAGFEAHHLLEKQFAARLGLRQEDTISVALTPMWHRNVGKMGTNLDDAISKELQALGTTKSRASVEQIWQAHRNVYDRAGYHEWSSALHKAYFEPLGVAY